MADDHRDRPAPPAPRSDEGTAADAALDDALLDGVEDDAPGPAGEPGGEEPAADRDGSEQEVLIHREEAAARDERRR